MKKLLIMLSLLVLSGCSEVRETGEYELDALLENGYSDIHNVFEEMMVGLEYNSEMLAFDGVQGSIIVLDETMYLNRAVIVRNTYKDHMYYYDDNRCDREDTVLKCEYQEETDKTTGSLYSDLSLQDFKTNIDAIDFDGLEAFVKNTLLSDLFEGDYYMTFAVSSEEASMFDLDNVDEGHHKIVYQDGAYVSEGTYERTGHHLVLHCYSTDFEHDVLLMIPLINQ